jgi:hypothetical protein
LQKQTGIVGTSLILMPNGVPSGNVDNTEIFEAVVNIIRRSKKDKVFVLASHKPNFTETTLQAEAAYFWATRNGDCIEVDLEDLPDQSLGW